MRFVPINQSDVPAVGSAVRLTKSFLSYLTGTAREMPVPLREPASPTSVQVLPHQGPSSVKVIVIIERTLTTPSCPGDLITPGASFAGNLLKQPGRQHIHPQDVPHLAFIGQRLLCLWAPSWASGRATAQSE